MKESLEEDLFGEKKELLSKIEEEELNDNVEEELLANEEELLANEEELLDTEEEQLLDTEEELIATEEELIATEEELLANEEELLLANYNKKQRGIALQEAYKEKLDVLLKKKNEINTKLDNFNRCGYNLFFNTDSSGLSESVVNKILLLRMIHINISKSISNEMPSSEEILRIAKKAGVFDSPYDILDLLKIRTNAFDNGHPFYDEYKDVLSNI
jgi:type I site-specific restriction endonuclease